MLVRIKVINTVVFDISSVSESIIDSLPSSGRTALVERGIVHINDNYNIYLFDTEFSGNRTGFYSDMSDRTRSSLIKFKRDQVLINLGV